MEQLSAHILGLLLQLEPRLLTNKATAARILVDLADVGGAISAIILLENGEETFQELLFDIAKLMDESAHEVAGFHPGDDERCAIN
jgi:hypothetical protein